MLKLIKTTLILITFGAIACSDTDVESPIEAPLPPAFVDLPSPNLFPEGILLLSNGDLMISGLGSGALVRVPANGESATFFKSPGEDGLSGPAGMAVDPDRNRLWVANFDFNAGQSNLKVFDLDSADLIDTVTPAEGLGPHFFNEIDIDAQGRVYVSDTLTPRIWTAGSDLDTVEVFVADPLLRNPNPERSFGLNGLSLTPDGTHIIASVMDRITQGGGRLVSIRIEDRNVEDVALSGSTAIFGGADGMLFGDDGQLIMVNVTPPAAIVTAEFDNGYQSAQLTERGRFDETFDRPTAPALIGDRLWVVNSQLDHIIDDQNGAFGTPPELPFRLSHVSLDQLLDR